MNGIQCVLVLAIISFYVAQNDGRPEAAIGGGFPSDNPWYRGDPTGNAIGSGGGGFTSTSGKGAGRTGYKEANSYPSNSYNTGNMYGYDYKIPGADVYFRAYRNGNAWQRNQ